MEALPKYLVKAQKRKIELEDVETLKNIAIFFESSEGHHPTLSGSLLTVILPFLKDAVKANMDQVGRLLFERIERLDTKKSVRKDKSDWGNINESKVNFRNFTILPDMNEILSEKHSSSEPQTLEENSCDVEQYLNIQFHLIRNYLICSIREKVFAFKNYMESGNQNLHEISSYSGVRITNILVSVDGVLYEIEFPHNSNLSRIPWDYSKHFTAGSLLCFSSDQFKTVFFATVVGHEAVLLQQGKVYVQFESEGIVGVSPKNATQYVVLEIDDLGDCFRILSNLQRSSSVKFPFQEYFLNKEMRARPPRYALDVAIKYCVNPVLSKTSDLETISKESTENSKDCPCIGDKLTIHDASQWAGFDFGLDEYQNHALRNALTQSLVVIQGSPGTGKTHVGVKLAQILLHNRQTWNTGSDHRPILFLAHSNYCLDSFLERIFTTTLKICRIGGKTENKLLRNCNLKSLATTTNTLYLTKRKREIGEKLKEVTKNISDIEDKKYRWMSELLSVEELTESNGQIDIERLKENCPPDFPSSVTMDTLLRSWLSIDVLLQDTQDYVQANTLTRDEVNPNFREKTSNGQREERDKFKYVRDANLFHNQRVIDGEFHDLTALFVIEANERERESSMDQEKGSSSDRKAIYNICQKLNVIPMTAAQSAFCTNLWNLSLHDRWKLYMFWLQKCIETYDKELRDCRQKYEGELSKLEANRKSVQNEALNNVDLLGITASAAAKYNDLIKTLRPSIIIVEDANLIPDCQILPILNEESDHLILIGDQNIFKSAGRVQNPKIATSLFDRLSESDFPSCSLRVQYNTRPCISELLVSAGYEDLHNHSRVFEYENIKGLQKNIFFFTHSVEAASQTGINDFDVNFIVELSRYILLQGYTSSSITILTPYHSQLYMLKKRMVGNLDSIRVSVLENFQESNDIILASFVRSESEQETEIFQENRLLYTSLTRAKKGLYCVGDFEAFANKSRIWKSLSEVLTKLECYGPMLNVMCQAHGNIAPIRTPRDIIRLGDGGCGAPCKFIMSCSHECPRKCHPNDREHNTKCFKQCKVILCLENHKCPKLCFEVCGNCTEILDSVFLQCGHNTQAPCFRVSLDKNCYWELPYKIDDSLYDKIEINVGFAVKFSVNISDYPCYPSLEQECKVPCEKVLECGHQCKGKCGECMGGRIHVPCTEICGKVQLCGHKCLYPCASPCPPCSFQYENECSHIRWTAFCGFPAAPCLKPCSWSCEHLRCSRLCHEPCDRFPCNKYCKEILKCGHSCIGMCGEPCPDKCRICDREEVSRIIFGQENDSKARFMCLEDCGHFFEINGFTNWICTNFSTSGVICLPKCPICLKPILKNKRLGNFIKTQLVKIETLKSAKYQMISNMSKTKSLLSDVKKQLKVLTKRNEKHERFWAEEQSTTDPCSILETIYARLFLKYNPVDQGTLDLFYNYYTFVVENYKLVSKLEKIQDLVCVPSLGTVARKIMNFVGNTLESVNERIVYFFEFGSPQFVNEIASELRRLNMACNFLVSYQNFFDSNNPLIRVKLEQALNLVLQNFPFRNNEGMFTLLLAELQMLSPDTAVLGNVSEPHVPVVETMDIQEGQWVECSFGHLSSLKRSEEVCQTCDYLNSIDESGANVP